MGKQCGTIKISGPVGNLSFYERDGQYYVRKQTRHDVRHDPRFKKTYLTGLDFGTASRASRLLCSALGHDIAAFAGTRLSSRLTGRFVKVVHADTTHTTGRRQVLQANLALLKGFEFNKHHPLNAAGVSASAVSIHRPSGCIKISLSAERPVELTIGIICINFTKDTSTHHRSTYICTTGNQENTELTLRTPIDADPHAAVIVTLGVSPGSAQPAAMTIIAACSATRVVQPSSLRAHHLIRRSIHKTHTHSRARCHAPRARETSGPEHALKPVNHSIDIHTRPD